MTDLSQHKYHWHPSGVKCQEICDDLPHWIGEAISCIWRRNHQDQPLDDRLKALEMLDQWSSRRYVSIAHIGVGREWYEKCIKVIKHSEMDPPLLIAIAIVAGANAAMPISEILQKHRELVKSLQDEIKELGG